MVRKVLLKTRDLEFESYPNHFCQKNTSLRHRLFYPVLMTVTFGLGFRVPVQKPVPKPFLTGAFGPFSSSVVGWNSHIVTWDLFDR